MGTIFDKIVRRPMLISTQSKITWRLCLQVCVGNIVPQSDLLSDYQTKCWPHNGLQDSLLMPYSYSDISAWSSRLTPQSWTASVTKNRLVHIESHTLCIVWYCTFFAHSVLSTCTEACRHVTDRKDKTVKLTDQYRHTTWSNNAKQRVSNKKGKWMTVTVTVLYFCSVSSSEDYNYRSEELQAK